MTAPGVIRLCAPLADLAPEDCAVPERCQRRICLVCSAPVHYDPKAAIPGLGPEVIVCLRCLDSVT